MPDPQALCYIQIIEILGHIMSKQKIVFKKGRWRKEIKKIIQLLKGGPHTTRSTTEIVAEEGYSLVSRKRIERHLIQLQKWTLVEKREGKWYWYEYLRTYDSREELEDDLKHSRLLLRDATQKDSQKIDLEYKPLRDHIRSGHLPIYDIYKEVKALQRRLAQKKERLDWLIKGKIMKKGLIPKKEKFQETKSVNQNRIREIINLHNRGQLRSDPDDIVEDKGRIVHSHNRADAFALSTAVNLGEVKQLLRDIANCDKVNKASKSFNRVQEELWEKNSELDEEVSYLKKKVEHGEPLRGSCFLCPKVRIDILR